MSLVQLKELIEEIYTNKKKFDIKCKKNNTARESMEQFIYLFFKQRFGLNNIVIEWVHGLIEALKVFSSSDSDVALFALILRNEVDEEFADIQSQIKGTIEDILLSLIESNNPNKNKKIINKMYETKRKGKISDNMALEIVNTMYTNEHPNKDEILIKLEKKFEQHSLKTPKFKKKSKKEKQTRSNTKKKKPMKIYQRGVLFSEIIKIILDMQLKTHFGFLRNLSIEFRKFDNQNYGFITSKQFRQLTNYFIEGIEIEINTDELITQRGSYDQAVVTFSDLVGLFSSKQIVSEGEEITMLQFIFEKSQGINA